MTNDVQLKNEDDVTSIMSTDIIGSDTSTDPCSTAVTEREDATMSATAEPAGGAAVDPMAADGIPVLEMIEPLAGFADHRTFALVRLDDEGTVCELQATDRPELSFLVVPPHMFFPDYAPLIDETTMKLLAITAAEDVLLLVLVNPGATLAETTANLLAPVLVNHRTRRAAQIVLDDASLSLRAPLAAT